MAPRFYSVSCDMIMLGIEESLNQSFVSHGFAFQVRLGALPFFYILYFSSALETLTSSKGSVNRGLSKFRRGF